MAAQPFAIPLTAGEAGLVPLPAAERRQLTVFGAPVELVCMPHRAARHGRPSAQRPAFRASIAERILAEEMLWSGGGLAVTANRYPFAAQQRIVWPLEGTREHGFELLAAVFDWVDRLDGTGFVNGVGAAASIVWAHAHVSPERQPFLAALGERPAAGDWLPAVAGVEFVHKNVPFCLLGVRGDAAARARAVVLLGLRRMTATVTMVSNRGVTWLLPRSVETPAPWFPYALGAAEVWGRWCYVEQEPFAAATAADLERALVAAGVLAIS